MQPRLVSENGLVLNSPAPALTVRNSQLAYMRGAVASPVCIAVAVFSSCVGLGFAGALGAITAMLAVAMVCAASTRYGFVRRHLDHQRQMHERCRRESTRLKQLRPTGPVRQQQYIELRNFVEEIERADASEAARFELQDLLEHFIRLATMQQRCLDALRLVGSHDLPHTISIGDATRSRRRREIQVRRLRHREECLARIDRLADELEAIDELVRLVAQRVACPAIDPDLDREIDRRLWELDEVDAALRQLSA
ncbi:MAG: hypothetical protein H6Q90_1207 [Deltaproteobacteria bacterium]|nr:hypothetical protein [Deltaproteobacteria bacterium]